MQTAKIGTDMGPTYNLPCSQPHQVVHPERPFRKPRTQRKWALLLLALLGSACSLPEYKLMVGNIPKNSTEVDVLVYLPGSSNQPVTQVNSTFAAGTASRTISINLKNGFDSPDRAVFGVISRDAAGCITGSINSVPQIPSSVVADVELSLVPVRYPKGADQLCRKVAPVAVDVEREEVGYFPNTGYHLLLSGWGFSKTDKVTIKSQLQLDEKRCAGACAMRCPESVTCSMTGVGPGKCQTGCWIKGNVEYIGPSLLSVIIPDQGQEDVIEVFAPPPPLNPIIRNYSFKELLGMPLTATVARSDGTQASSFAEQLRTP